MDVQSIQPGYKVDPSQIPPEVLQWYMQQQQGSGQAAPPMQGMPQGMSPDQLKQLMMIQQMRQQQGMPQGQPQGQPGQGQMMPAGGQSGY